MSSLTLASGVELHLLRRRLYRSVAPRADNPAAARLLAERQVLVQLGTTAGTVSSGCCAPICAGMGLSAIGEGRFEPSLDIFVNDPDKPFWTTSVSKTWCMWGESFGGILGLNFAHRHPERVRALVLCNTPCRLPSRERSGREGDTDDALEP